MTDPKVRLSPIDQPAKRKKRAYDTLRRPYAEYDQLPGWSLADLLWRTRKRLDGFLPELSHIATKGYVPADFPFSGFVPGVKLDSPKDLKIKSVTASAWSRARLVPERKPPPDWQPSKEWLELQRGEGWGMVPMGRVMANRTTAAQRLASFDRPSRSVRRDKIKAARRRPIL